MVSLAPGETDDHHQRFFGFCAFGTKNTLHFGWLAQAGE